MIKLFACCDPVAAGVVDVLCVSPASSQMSSTGISDFLNLFVRAADAAALGHALGHALAVEAVVCRGGSTQLHRRRSNNS